MNLPLKISATKLLVLSVAYSAVCSSSDYTYGYTNNAAAGGYSWSMSSPVLGVAPVEGMDINGVIYRYTAVKNQADAYIVSIQNEAADGNGFIFRSTDDWTGKSGTTLTRYVPVPYSPVGNWGTGSIDEVGIGSIEDPQVVYTFRLDPCYNPQNDPSCPNYVPPLPELPVIEVYDAMSDQYVQMATEPTDLSLLERDTDEKNDSERDDEGERLEVALSAAENALTIGVGVSQAQLLQAMNTATNLNAYYASNIQGGVYKETTVLSDNNIPDNRRAFRSMGQQVLHDEMVNQQWR